MNGRSGAQPAAVATPPQLLVVGIFDHEVRAWQALEALHVWRQANPGLGVGPTAVAGRHHSGSTSFRVRGVLRPRRGALWGLVIGVILLALPAAGAAGLVGWLLGTVAFGLTGLVGITPGDQSGSMAFVAGAATAFLAALVTAVLGAIAGCLIGLMVGLIDNAARGMSRSDTAVILAALRPGSWATLARARPPADPLVRDEMTRLGATPTYAEVLPLKALPASSPEPAAASSASSAAAMGAGRATAAPPER